MNPEWRENDGIVPTISALHPFGQAAKKVASFAEANAKGVWQMLPTMKDWNHMDLIGIDNTNFKRTEEELEKFYTSILDHVMCVEEMENQEVVV